MDNVFGLITNVQRFSIHDGPGIRTTVFFKGCPLRCFWCHNPETWRMQPEIQLFTERCIGCGECIKRCPQGAHKLADEMANGNVHEQANENEDGQIDKRGDRQVDGRRDRQRLFNRELCLACGKCAESCYAGALVMTGKWWTPEELLEELMKDHKYYEESGGGITLSGGEPLLQQKFCLRILQLCKDNGLSTAIETAGFCRWEDLEGLLPWLDLIIMDIKHLDDEQHKAVTGVSNRRILENAQRLSAAGMPLLIRTPVIPGVNDTPEAIGAVAGFIRSFPNLLYYELMPFHRMGEGKFRSLGLTCSASSLTPPSADTMQALARHARDCGVRDVKVE